MRPVKMIDITGDTCPVTFVRVRLALEEMSAGEVLAVRLKAGEAARNVPRSLHAEGHKILSLARGENEVYLLEVEKGGSL